ncbi:MAG TPA: glycosyltransferase family 4 protein [Pyrinomonadaceae bacterium]|nr:glycosyltransferase family 4 protein [Pyrinomonadaceae bacterium]
MSLEGRRVLFISYNGMLEPLGQTQVLTYLRELSKRGVKFTLLSFEREKAFTPDGARQCEVLKEELQKNGIEWHWLRYHQRPSLPATLFDVVQGIRVASRLVQQNDIELVHARSHIPATIALALKRKFGTKIIFDVRGLMAEEYVDAQHWPAGGLRFRVTKATERRIFAATDAVVTLTERIWPIIRDWDGLRGREVQHAVVPCCVDLSLFRADEEMRAKLRAELGLGERLTLVYSGSLDGWYLTEGMADFFASVVRRCADAHLLWLTVGSRERVRQLMSARGISEHNFSVHAVAPKDVPAYLAAGDVGISFIKRCFSKLASSPTKNGEYLACGLPIVINSGIGDSDRLAKISGAAILVDDVNEQDFERAWLAVQNVIRDPQMKAKARELAEKEFDLVSVGGARYASLYEAIFNRN